MATFKDILQIGAPAAAIGVAIGASLIPLIPTPRWTKQPETIVRKGTATAVAMTANEPPLVLKCDRWKKAQRTVFKRENEGIFYDWYFAATQGNYPFDMPPSPINGIVQGKPPGDDLSEITVRTYSGDPPRPNVEVTLTKWVCE